MLLKSFIFIFFKKSLYFFFKKKYPFKPIFIIGCGRSGTTILGKILSKHPRIAYLNERRDLWHKAYPELDIWSGKYSNPKLFLDEKDNKKNNTNKLKILFHEEQVYRKGSLLLEKLPINNFRLKFIRKCFPNAKYIYLHRNGLEVAQSIEKAIPKGWFGKNELKLTLLIKHSNKSNLRLTKNIHKGLFEWSTSMSESHKFFKELDNNLYVNLSYQDLIDQPKECISKILTFLEINYDKKLIEELSCDIERKSKAIHKTDDEVLKSIGGNLLTQSIKNNYDPKNINL